MERWLVHVVDGVPTSEDLDIVGTKFEQEGLTGLAWFEKKTKESEVKLVGVIKHPTRWQDLALLDRFLINPITSVSDYLFHVAAAIAMLGDDMGIHMCLGDELAVEDAHSRIANNIAHIAELAKGHDIGAMAFFRLLHVYKDICALAFSMCPQALSQTPCQFSSSPGVTIADIVGPNSGELGLSKFAHSVGVVNRVELSGALIAVCRQVIKDHLEDCGNSMYRALSACTGHIRRDVLAHESVSLANNFRLLGLGSLRYSLPRTKGFARKLHKIASWLAEECSVELTGEDDLISGALSFDSEMLETRCVNWKDFESVCKECLRD